MLHWNTWALSTRVEVSNFGKFRRFLDLGRALFLLLGTKFTDHQPPSTEGAAARIRCCCCCRKGFSAEKLDLVAAAAAGIPPSTTHVHGAEAAGSGFGVASSLPGEDGLWKQAAAAARALLRLSACA